MTMEVLATTATQWGLQLSARQLDQFQTYASELAAWNARLNLTAVDDAYGIVVRHFLDSLACARFWGQPQSLIDIGSGAGFPGLPLKLLRPDLQLCLVESVAKKATFLEHMVAILGLSKVQVLTTRAEDLGQHPAHREHYDLATARAVAPLAVLAEYCLPFCRVGGRFLAPKGPEVADELTAATTALTILGGRLLGVERLTIADLPPRTMIVVEKAAPTPSAYPRRTGLPSRRPL